jgi:hypothetical protein
MLKELHAELVGKAVVKERYPPDWIQRVQGIIRKKDPTAKPVDLIEAMIRNSRLKGVKTRSQGRIGVLTPFKVHRAPRRIDFRR